MAAPRRKSPKNAPAPKGSGADSPPEENTPQPPVETSPQPPAEVVTPLDTEARDARLKEVLGQKPKPSMFNDPNAPAMTPEAGDKTPAFVSWALETYPEEATRHYAGRKVTTEAGLLV